jgi:hypothetical protein
MSFELHVRNGSHAGERIALAPGTRLTVGRNRADLLCADDAAMSGLHFELRSENGKVGLKNHSTTNGTWINGELCDLRILQPGDRITAGTTEFVFVWASMFQGWSFEAIPQSWEIIPEQGLRYARTEKNITTIITSQDRLPEGYDFNAYIDLQLELITRKLPQSELTRTDAQVPESQASAGLNIRTPLEDQRTVIQKQVYAVVGPKVGILTATTFETEPPDVHAGIDQLLSTGIFRPQPNT